MTKWRALIAACGLLLAALAFRVFYIQELFFAFLLFAIAYLLLLLLVAALFCALYVYARGMVYLAVRISAEGHRFAAVSRPGPLARPHSHPNGPSPAGRAAHFVLSLSWVVARVVSVLPLRYLAIP